MVYPEIDMREPQEDTPFTPEEKIRQLEEKVARLTAENEKLALLATKDSLTGLDNDHSLEEKLPAALAGAIRDQKDLSAIFVDLDGLKAINDAGGHQAGDEALKTVASTLAQGVRLTDTVFRLHGDELLVLLPGTSKPYAVEVSLRLLEAVRSLGSFTVSMGVNTFRPPAHDLSREQNLAEHGQTLVMGADRALYQAKKGGRNRVGIMIDGDPEKFEIGELVGIQARENVTLARR